jgi:acetyl esterase/lipase
LSAGDPPAFLYYTEPDAGIHHPKFGYYLKEKCDAIRTECTVKLRTDYGDPDGATRDMAGFFAKKLNRPNSPVPDLANVTYGPHGRNILDFYSARTEKPAPLVLFIHGGGFVGGDKTTIDPLMLQSFLKEGWSVASLNYRFSNHAPYPAPMEDCKRALQFLRAHAGSLNIDSKRVASTGGSAGAIISFWIAFRDDMADPASSGAVARQSTRLRALALLGAQSFLEPRMIRDRISDVTAHHPALPLLYGIKPEELYTDRAAAQYQHASAVTWLTKDDPPAWLFYNEPRGPVPADARAGTGIHHIIFGNFIKERMDKLGIECVVRHADELGPNPGVKIVEEMTAFLRKYLRQAASGQ